MVFSKRGREVSSQNLCSSCPCSLLHVWKDGGKGESCLFVFNFNGFNIGLMNVGSLFTCFTAAKKKFSPWAQVHESPASVIVFKAGHQLVHCTLRLFVLFYKVRQRISLLSIATMSMTFAFGWLTILQAVGDELCNLRLWHPLVALDRHAMSALSSRPCLLAVPLKGNTFLWWQSNCRTGIVKNWAYSLIVNFLRIPAEEIHRQLGDTVLSHLSITVTNINLEKISVGS